MSDKNYNIRQNVGNNTGFHCVIEWVDEYGKDNLCETDDVLTAQTVIGLLSGEICLADLEP